MIKVLSDKEALRELLYYKKSRGFSKFHFPGGTDDSQEHYSATYGLIFDQEGYWVGSIGVPYAPDLDLGKESKNLKPAKKTAKVLAKNKFLEKTGLSPVSKFVPFKVIEVSDNRPEFKGKIHRKYFFCVDLNSTKGKLLNLMYTNYLNRETATPLPVSILFLVKNITYGHHFDALVELIDILSLRIRNDYLIEIREAIKNRKDYVNSQYEKNKKRYTITLKPK